MKKRVLSFLLLLAMLVTMVPTMAVGSSANTDAEEPPRSETNASTPISDYYELYKTDGLVAFFDAIDPANGTLDLTNGKWYARVYNAETGKFEVSETIYATIKGAGWEALTNGFGYADPDYTAGENVIEFKKSALLHSQEIGNPPYANWTVEANLRVDLRDVADNAGASADAFVFGPVNAKHGTNLQAGDLGKATWSLVGKTAVEIAKGSTSFVDNNGKFATLAVSKIAVSKTELKYTVTHGATSATSATVKNGDYPENALYILKNEQGAIRTFRVYGSATGEALTASEMKANATVDTLIRLGVDLDKFNKVVELGDSFVQKFLSEIAPAKLADADKEAFELGIEAAVVEELELRNIKVLSDYEKLYVGADGSETANGGKLVSLFSATGKSVDLENGVWINKIGDTNASFGNYQTGIWEKRADGGVGYTGLYGQFDSTGALKTTIKGEDGTNLVTLTNTVASGTGNTNTHLKTRLDFGLKLLPKDDYTIEYVAKYNPIYVADPNAEDKIARDAYGNPIEFYKSNKNQGIGSAQYTAPLDWIGFISSWTVYRDGSYSTQMPARGDVIWMISPNGNPSWAPSVAWVGTKAFTGGGGLLAQGVRDYGKVHTYVFTRDETLRMTPTGDRVVDATYSILRDSVLFAKENLSTANRAAADLNGDGKTTSDTKDVYEDWGKVYYDKDDVGNFYLSSSLPTDFYTVRIYDGVLTGEELAFNAFIDMAAYANASLDVYNGLDDEIKGKVVSALIGLGFTTDSLEFAANLAKVIDLYANMVTAEDTLYAQDGLRVLTAAYEGMDTGSLISTGVSISWFNAAVAGEIVTLKGAEWTRRANADGAGYYILKQYNEMQTAAARSFGIYLTEDMLPKGNYTIELIVNPTGIIQYNEDGSYERYVDRSTTYGVHYENGFMIGPLRCLIFPTLSDGGASRAHLEKRWCYDRGNECWNNTSTRKHIGTESAWRQSALNDIIAYNIDYELDRLTGKGVYTIYNDFSKSNTFNIKPEDLITNEDANNAFQMMVGMPGGVFSIRVYERVLTEAEKLQNHAADIIYYYDLDTTLLDKVLPYFKDDPTVVFRGLSDLSFDLPREEAQKVFDAKLSALWLGFDGVSVRNDYTNGMRYYFTLDETTATAMLTAGFQIEIGAIANIGQNALPSLDGHNYDYKIVAYDGLAGRNTGFFIDKNTFAVTVKAGSANKHAMLSQVNVLGYIRLVTDKGEVMTFYVDTNKTDYTPDSFFSVYNYMMEREDIITELALIDHLNAVADGCYEREYIHLKADAADGGNGTAEAPYNDFADAFYAAKTRVKNINVPTYLYVYAAEGVYEIHELLSIDGSEIPYQYARLVISSQGGKGTLTSTRKIDKSNFLEAENNIWTYQFEADANGEYPNLRYIYVNGKIGDIAHNGANSFLIADETRYMTKFYRWDIGPWKNARAEWEAGRLKHDTLFYDLSKVDLNTRFAHYRDQYLAYEEVANAGSALLPTTVTKATNYSSYYPVRFQEVKFNHLAYMELNNVYYTAGGGSSTGTVEALKTYVSVYSLDSDKYAYNLAYTRAKEAYETASAAALAAAQAYDAAVAALEGLTEGTDEYTAAVEAVNAAQIALDAANAEKATKADERTAAETVCMQKRAEAKPLVDAYIAAFTVIKSAVSKALNAGTKMSDAIAPYMLINPSNNYPKSADINDLKENYPWPEAPSTGVYAEVTALFAAGQLTHASQPFAGDKNLAQELQFLYYRDAYLALEDVNVLDGDEFNLTAQAPDAEGSAQYKALFLEFLYTKIAVNELTAKALEVAHKNVNNVVSSWQIAPVAVYTTSYANAPAGYVEIFTEIRDAQVRYGSTSNFGDFSEYLPDVEEADAPYEGTVPYSTTLSQYKIYLPEKLVGDQAFAIAQGRDRLAATAKNHVDTAYAKYLEAYNALAALQAEYEHLVNEGLTNDAKSCNDRLVAARNAAKTAYTALEEKRALAERYLTDEYDEAFVLEGSGIQISMPTEWTYNVVNMTGVDYDDYIMSGKDKHIAMYYDGGNPMSIHNESHVYNRMCSLSGSHAYLDKNNEYYYNPLTGTLYYYNTWGIDDCSFEYPTMNNMFYLSNIKSLYFEDINFTGLDYTTMNAGFTGGQASSDGNINPVGEKDTMPSGAALYGKMIRGLTVRNCTFHDLGCEAISFRNRIEDTLIEGCTFTNIGSGAIRFGGGSASEAIWSELQGTENCTITNNYLDGIAIYIYCSPAITTQFSKDLECSYNTILNCSYSGYSIGWSWSWAAFMYGEQVKLMHVDIHHNYIASFMQQMGDGGAIYTLGGNAVKEEHTLFNWCHDNFLMMTNTTGDGEGRFAAANYHDGSSSNWETYNTVVAAYSYGAAFAGDTYGHTVSEDISESFFDTIDTEFSKEEYTRRIRNNYNRYWAFYEQTLDSAQAFNITLRDNFLINVRNTKTDGTKMGTMFYEAYRNGVTAEDFIFVENMTYVKDPSRIPARAEDIIYDAGCDWVKGDPFLLADNNY